ncbi:hypothetical protein [Colwellia psychrerythraea]|nr:hypothetical protein [Colwellia psychrerythraea]
MIADNGIVVALSYEDLASGEVKQQSVSGIFAAGDVSIVPQALL